MIEIKDVSSFSLLQCKTPYFIFFFKKECDEIKDESNLLFIKYLRSIEEVYCDLPMIAFDYLKFINRYNNYYISSSNDVLVIQKSKPVQIYKKPSPSEINEILKKIREENILIHQKAGSKKNYSTNIRWRSRRSTPNIGYISINDPNRVNYQNKLMGLKDGNYEIVKDNQIEGNLKNNDTSTKTIQKFIDINNKNLIDQIKKSGIKITNYSTIVSNKDFSVKEDNLLITNTEDFLNFPSTNFNFRSDNLIKNEPLKSNNLIENIEKNNNCQSENMKFLDLNGLLTPSSLLEFPQKVIDPKNFQHLSKSEFSNFKTYGDRKRQSSTFSVYKQLKITNHENKYNHFSHFPKQNKIFHNLKSQKSLKLDPPKLFKNKKNRKTKSE